MGSPLQAILARLQGNPLDLLPRDPAPRPLHQVLMGAQLRRAQHSPYDPTFAPGEATLPDIRNRLGEIMLAAGSMAIPAIAPKRAASVDPARIRPNESMEQNTARALREVPKEQGQSLESLNRLGAKTVRQREGKSLDELMKKIGGLANTSKLECEAWGIPASMCGVGGRLRTIEGSVCHDCYAQGTTGSGQFKLSMYGQENVKQANLNRFESWRANPAAWEKNMSAVLAYKPLFRWFDSGDLQGMEMLNSIVNVARATPATRHWLPTKERPVVDRWLRAHPEGFPENLQVRISLPMKEQLPENYKRLGTLPSANLPVAGVSSDPSKVTCPGGGGRGCAPKGEEPCRDCFTSKDVTYIAH